MKKLIPLILIIIAFSSACHSQSSAKTSYKAAPELTSLTPIIYFELNKADVTDESIIEKNARWMLTNRDKVVILEGHCDERGDAEFNFELGDRRARAVMEALMAKGVSENQLIIISYGKRRPAVKTYGEQGWAQNRRVEFVVR